jgi:hypothetical protein
MISTLVGSFRGYRGDDSPKQRVNSHVLFMDLDMVRRPHPRTFVTLGYTDGFDVYVIESGDQEHLVCSKKSETGGGVKVMKVLYPNSNESVCRNLAVVYERSENNIQFVDMTTNSEYHTIRLTAPIVKIQCCSSSLLTSVEGGRIHIFDSASLEEKFTVSTTRHGNVWDLSDRWLAFNLSPQQTTNLRSSSEEAPATMFGKVWQKLSALSQDAFDNMVLAVSKSDQAPTMSSLQSPTKSDTREFRNGIVVIQDVGSQKVIGTIEERLESINFTSRAIECIQWSNCGSFLLVTSGNGHNISLYGIETGRDDIHFSLKQAFNRGLTPAVISSMCMDTHGRTMALYSSNGSVHLFNVSSGERTGKISPVDCSGTIRFNQKGILLVLETERGSVSIYDGIERKKTLQLVRAPGCVEDKLLTHVFEKPSEPKRRIVLLEKPFRPRQVSAWESPLLSFWKVNEETGEQEQIKPVRNFGIKVSYDTSTVSFKDYQESLQQGLSTPVVLEEETPEMPKYVPKPTKEGFVQLVPQ